MMINNIDDEHHDQHDDSIKRQTEQTQNQILNHTIFHIDQCLDG